MKKLTYIIGRHGIEINIHGCQPYPGNCYLCNEISKRRTIMHTNVLGIYNFDAHYGNTGSGIFKRGVQN